MQRRSVLKSNLDGRIRCARHMPERSVKLQPASFYEPVQHRLDKVNNRLRGMAEEQHPFLAKLLDHILSSPGKYIRPAITLLASSFHPHDEKRTEDMALGIELLHIASLIHDDTVDEASVRRGKATISNLWGSSAAVLAGDYIFAASAIFVCDTGDIRAMRRFAETIMELSSGELQEMSETHNPHQSMDGYLNRIYKKTASLFTTASESGALLSGAPAAQVAALRNYGYNLGMAFQVVDDILDFDGDEQEIGKPIGSDLANGIVTLPTLMAMKRKPYREAITEALLHPSDKALLDNAVSIVRQPDILKASYDFADAYCNKARESLATLPQTRARDSLEELVSHVKLRRG